MKRMGAWGSKGFALPTVMIASVVMLMVLMSGLVSASSINSAIRDQHKQKAVELASEAGVAMVNACLAQSFNVVTWTGKVLRPNTDCNGDPTAGSAYIMDTPTLKTTFEVPELVVENGTQRANVTARILSYRASGFGAPQEKTYSKSALIGGQTSFSNVTFGYCSSGCGADQGAQLAVVLATGEVKTLGRNNNGRLGAGTLVDSATPSTFILPINERGIAAFSNFLSIGRQLSVITASGKAFSAGSNEFGQLGNPASGTVSPRSTPVQFVLPANENARFVGVSNYATYVITQNSVTGNTSIYAAGSCTNGILGTGAGCAQTATPTRVALPAPTSDQNTQPEPISDWVQSTNFSVDRFNAYVRMKGGAVYGWGINDWGQLGDATMTTRSTPIRIQALGSFVTPSAKQIAFSGNSLYILDTNGRVWATGENASYGELAGAGTAVRNGGNTTVCLRKDPGSSYVVTPACDGNDGFQFMEWWPDGTWRFRTDSRTYNPTDSMLCATAPSTLGGTSYVQMLPCTGAANQQWQVRGDKTIYSPFNNGCIEPYANVYMVACNPAYTYQQWTVQNSLYLRPLPTPPGNPLATRITTDNSGVLIRYVNGDVWAAGGNNRGQLGVGPSFMSTYNPVLRKVVLPAGLKAENLYTTDLGPVSPATGVNDGSYNNSYFVMEDGSVYGSGANNFGQLGVNSAYDYAATPVKMQLPNGVVAKTVQTAYGTTVILTSTGKIYTVGNNSNGQLGDGTNANSYVPMANTYTNQRTTIVY